MQILIWHNSWVRKETAGIHEDTCLLFTEVYLFVYTLYGCRCDFMRSDTVVKDWRGETCLEMSHGDSPYIIKLM